MDQTIVTLLTVGVVNLLMFPLAAWLIRRFVGKRLDVFDERRELARKQAENDVRENRLWRQAMESGLRSLLRSELISEHRKAVKSGYYDLQSREYVSRVMQSYHSLGGNDIGDQLYDEMVKLPTKPPKKGHEEEDE